MSKDTDSCKVILLVDDDEIHLSITEVSLHDEYEIYMVKSGEEALEFLGKNEVVPDLILLDVVMPMMDGWIVFDKINDMAALKFTPILFYSSLDEESAREKAYELGASDYISKPCDQPILLSKIKDALQKAELKKNSMEYNRAVAYNEGYHTVAEFRLKVRRGIKPAYRRYEVTALVRSCPSKLGRGTHFACQSKLIIAVRSM
jgi:CheY-like chemotaxis protein